eukprot:827292-Amphidinium_carterae.1
MALRDPVSVRYALGLCSALGRQRIGRWPQEVQHMLHRKEVVEIATESASIATTIVGLRKSSSSWKAAIYICIDIPKDLGIA